MILECEEWCLYNFVSYVNGWPPIGKDDDEKIYKKNIKELIEFILTYELVNMPEFFLELVRRKTHIGRKKNVFNHKRIMDTFEVFQEIDLTVKPFFPKYFNSVAKQLADILVKGDIPLEENKTIKDHYSKPIYADLLTYIKGVLKVREHGGPGTSKRNASFQHAEDWEEDRKKSKVESVKILQPKIKQEIKDEN